MGTFDHASRKSDSTAKPSRLTSRRFALQKAPAPEPTPQPAPNPEAPIHRDLDENGNPGWWSRMKFDVPRDRVQPKFTFGAPTDQQEQETDRPNQPAQSDAPPAWVTQPALPLHRLQRQERDITPIPAQALAKMRSWSVARSPVPPISNVQAHSDPVPYIPPTWGDRMSFEPQRPSMVQPKLTVGAPNDQYEQEADRVADQVMSLPDAAVQQPVQREAMSEEEAVQTKSLTASIAPLVQREAIPEDEEPIQAKASENADIQREALPEEKDALQTKSSPTPDTPHPTPSLETQLSNTQGSGSPLPDDVRSFMEPRFGADFSQVRVHTGSDSVQMNRDLNAQAFTHKQDVYFGAGKAPGNDSLTAHELTHVVQQVSGEKATTTAGDSPIRKRFGQFIQHGKGASKLPSTSSNTSILREGSRGSKVAELQGKLNAKRIQPPLKVDTIFGPITKSAVESFQATHQDSTGSPLKVDGIAGEKTQTALDQPGTPTPEKESGVFAAFVSAGFIDDDIANLLDEMHGFPLDSMARQVAVFAHHELSNRNLIGIVRGANALKIKALIGGRSERFLDASIKSGDAVTGNAFTQSFQDGEQLRGYILYKNTFLDTAKKPGTDRDFVILTVAHELTHFRNRTQARKIGSEDFSTKDYVNVAAAKESKKELKNAKTGATIGSFDTRTTRSQFIDELAARHVAWQVQNDQRVKNAQPSRSSLVHGQFFRAALNFAKSFSSYNDSGYMETLNNNSQEQFRRQVGLWLSSLARMDFHDDPAKNVETKIFIAEEFNSVQPDFNEPSVPSDGIDS